LAKFSAICKDYLLINNLVISLKGISISELSSKDHKNQRDI